MPVLFVVVDVAVVGLADDGRAPLLAIGEVKWGEVMGKSHLARLQRIRTLITAQGRYDTSGTRLLCFSATGFTDELHEAERSGEVTLIGVDQLYQS